MSVELFAIMIQTAAMAFLVIRTIRIAGDSHRSMMTVFFLFAAISLLVNNAYWVAYDLLRPETRMPFAANEIGESASFLLLASSLSAAVPDSHEGWKSELIGTILFILASVGLWIGWSGEWIQDILGGITYGYFLCIVIRSLKQTEALSGVEWRLLAAGSALLIAAQTSIFALPEPFKAPMDLFCYILMFAGMLFFIIRGILYLRRKEESGKTIAMAFAAYAWTTSTIYMSAGIWYASAAVVISAPLLMMLFAVEGMVKRHDLR